MSTACERAKSIFLTAAEIASPEERRVFVEAQCKGDDSLRSEVEDLLRHQNLLGRFLEVPAVMLEGQATDDLDVSISEGPGAIIGPYKLLEQIGEGGFGVVFLAEQEQPIHRRVALKIIKPGMDTRQVISRFEAEQQALALMDHPNIAKVFDAGTTGSGRPYFVMELVHGVPITDYCDQCNVTTRARLELFITVCQAVQHAHQKGVIHRDIKPTNVLVAIQDGQPSPKIIDFGVAKATGKRLSEQTLTTGFAQLIGTPQYMSPEQAELSPLGVDTRCDIYSLGVLLYELLTGTTPVDKDRLRAAPYDELRNIIREEEPPQPSARISTLEADVATTIAEHRRTEPRRLLQSVRGELDWIVMKCLEKERNRRYETANGLVRDIERFLDDEPVQACPPSAAYRFRKFARRNKGVLVAATAIVAMLLLLILALALSNRMIAAERNEKARALAEKGLALERAEAERQHSEENFRRARIAVRGILSDAARGVGEWSELSPSLRKKFAQETVNYYGSLLHEESADPSLKYETAVGYRSLSAIYNSLSEREEAEEFLGRSIAILERLAREYPKAVQYRHQLAYTHYMLGGRFDLAGKSAEAEAALRRSVELYEQLVSDRPEHGSYYLELAACYRILIRLQDKRGKSQEAGLSTQQLADLMRKAASSSPSISDLEMVWRLELRPKAPPASPIAPDVSIGIAEAMINVGRLEEAAGACRKTVRAAPDDAAARYCLAYVQEVSGKFDEAIFQLQKAIDLEPDYVDAHNGLAWLLSTCTDSDLLDPERAVTHATHAVEHAPTHAAFWNVLGIAHYGAADFVSAKEALDKAIELEGDDAYVGYFLAMSEWQLGNEVAARESYQQAAEWMKSHRPEDEVLHRFRREAAELLGEPDP